MSDGAKQGPGRRIAFLGGDRREAYAAQVLAAAGWHVRAAGLTVPRSLRAVGTTAQLLAESRGLVTPMRGLDEGRCCYTLPEVEPVCIDPDCVAALAPGTLWICGRADARISKLAAAAGCSVVSIAERDDFAILNAVPTAEGAVLSALQAAPVTLHGSRTLVLGFGRTGQSLAWLLDGMGARVDVWVRRATPAARAASYGYGVLHGAQLDEALGGARFIFNTVPARVLNRRRLERTDPAVVVVDIASAPGGVDFAAAKALERTAVHALGLPGRVAPESGGAILAGVIARVVEEAETSSWEP